MPDYRGLREPIFVIGPGRSGTSYMAQQLYTRFGVCMGNPKWIGNSWERKNWRTTTGHWERMTVRAALGPAIVGDAAMLTLVETLKELQYMYIDRPWGVKHPNLTMFLPVLIPHFQDAWYIYCHRDPEDNADSMMKLYTKSSRTREQWLEEIKELQDTAFHNLCYANKKTVVQLTDWKEFGDEAVLSQVGEFLQLPLLDEPLPIPEPYHDYGECGGLLTEEMILQEQKRAQSDAAPNRQARRRAKREASKIHANRARRGVKS